MIGAFVMGGLESQPIVSSYVEIIFDANSFFSDRNYTFIEFLNFILWIKDIISS